MFQNWQVEPNEQQLKSEPVAAEFYKRALKYRFFLKSLAERLEIDFVAVSCNLFAIDEMRLSA